MHHCEAGRADAWRFFSVAACVRNHCNSPSLQHPPQPSNYNFLVERTRSRNQERRRRRLFAGPFCS
jgi:hypothetical protein